MLRVMLDVSLLRRATFVLLAVSVLLCYSGQSRRLFALYIQ